MIKHQANTYKTYGMQHIGMTVPSISDALAFFKSVFDAVEILSTGSLDAADDFMEKNLGVPQHCRIKDICVIRVGRGTNIELFEYQGDEADSNYKRNSQIGGFHLAFEVDDVNRAIAKLKKVGAKVFEGPTLIEEGPMEGLTWVYFRTPWGHYMELVSFDKLGYEKTTSARAWSTKGDKA